MRFELRNIFIPLVFGTIGSLIFMLVYNQFYQKTFGVIRMDEILVSHLSEFGSKELGQNERDELSKKYARILEKVLSRVSEKEKVILLVSPATVTKLPDYTIRVKNEIRGELDAGKK